MIVSGNQTFTLPGLTTNTTDVSTIVSVPGCGSQGPYSLVVPSISGVTPIAVYDPIIKNGQMSAAIPHLLPPAVPEVSSIALTEHLYTLKFWIQILPPQKMKIRIWKFVEENA